MTARIGVPHKMMTKPIDKYRLTKVIGKNILSESLDQVTPF